jgi:predicted TPR repeat methyltransferase
LGEAVGKSDTPEEPLRVLDFGAGNGIVGEIIRRKLRCEKVIGVDIIPEAKEAAYRDRPDVYDDYFILDFCSLSDDEQKKLEACRINSLVTVAALGFHDISTQAFLTASELLPEGGWISFNIRDKFLSDTDCSGFHDTIEEMMNDTFSVVALKRYCHRESLCGEKLYYYAIVARKIPDSSAAGGNRTLSDLCQSST